MKYIWHKLIHCDNTLPLQNIHSGIQVWIERPNVLNRRVIGVEILDTVRISNHDCLESTLVATSLQNNLRVRSVDDFVEVLGTYAVVNTCEENSGTFPICHLRRSIPRNTKLDDILEIIIVDELEESVTFIPTECNSTSRISLPFPLKITWEDGRIMFSVADTEGGTMMQKYHQSIEWLKTEVFPKVLRWSEIIPKSVVIPSLSKVPVQTYCKHYRIMKEKYGKKLVESWPEKTDPSKFVYEDIAIAAYLITVWEVERKLTKQSQKQSFIDLGCGNGLLVHLLSSEGHSGLGIDIRKRKIWDFFGPETNLIEKEIVPSASGLFPGYDWIIGNHSDELTPWIPVIAARSSYSMRVFLLPCCAFTFDGKYDRGNSSSSKYQSYLNFIEELCVTMGFNVQRDKLRIPSTKRVCFVCSSRNYGQEMEKEQDRIRTEYIKMHAKYNCEISSWGGGKNEHKESENFMGDDAWSETFKPRSKIEAVRNCCSLDHKFIEATVIKILHMLIACEESYVELTNEKHMWRCGGRMSIKLLAEKLGHEVLSKLKSQCGGLQTLIRNHRNVFTVESGYVFLRTPDRKTTEAEQKGKQHKAVKSFPKKACVFFFHHPDGCPFFDHCTFSHSKAQ